MSKKVALVTTGHPPLDERIYWKFARSISSNGYETAIFCSTENIFEERENILINGFKDDRLSRKEKLNKLYLFIRQFKPDLVICSEVSAIIPAHKYKKFDNKNCKIVSDITEWYPENVAFKRKGFVKFLIYFFLSLINILLVNYSDHLVIGENGKKRRYNLLAPLKAKTIIRYYPILQFFKFYPPDANIKKFTLCYAGLINFERGILTLLQTAIKLAERHKHLTIKLKIIGKFQYINEETEFNKIIENVTSIEIERINWTDYNKISEYLMDVHLCFDLRKRNFIYRHSLPIKIFEYMACGKPFIYSDIKPIREELKNYDRFGVLVNPDSQEEIIKATEKYLNAPDLLLNHSQNCRKEIEEGKNWETEAEKLITLVKHLI